MKKLSKNKKRFLILLFCLGILTPPELAYTEEQVVINESYELGSHDPFATYSKGNIYIGSEEFIDGIKDDSNNIYIIDKRDSSDPDMSIYMSYKIRGRGLKNAIIDVMMEYEDRFPSRWFRTKKSMGMEWFGHDTAHNLFMYEVERTSQVDFNNADEERYKSLIKMLENPFDY